MEDRKKEWFGVTMAGSGGPVETVVLEVETVVGNSLFGGDSHLGGDSRVGGKKGTLGN